MNELTVRNNTQLAANALTPQTWQMLTNIAPMIYESRMYAGVNSPQAAAAIMLKGYELGLGFSAAFEFIKPIQGKYELIPRGALALLHSSPFVKAIDVKRITGANGQFAGYECTITRTNGFSYTARYCLEDAQKAGLVKKDSGWEKYPENMCLWRAIGFAADVAAPDITGGLTGLMKMPEQYDVSLDVQGNVIDAPVMTTSPGASVAAPVYTGPVVTLEQLMAQYGPDAVTLGAQMFLGGRMPANQDDVNMLAVKLGEMA